MIVGDLRWMEEILHHQKDPKGWLKPYKSWNKPSINWCRISQPSTVAIFHAVKTL